MDRIADQEARSRFRDEWEKNFAVSANAGSGKTTAISQRLAALALTDRAGDIMPRTAVVTYTNKAARQIGQRARSVLLRILDERGPDAPLGALDHLECAFFGTIHSFCLHLARRYGHELGINLNPEVIAGDDEKQWEDFIEQDAMQFQSLSPEALRAFLRHVPLEDVFALARQLDVTKTARLAQSVPGALPSNPSDSILAEILALEAKGSGRANIEATRRSAARWAQAWTNPARGFLPLFEPLGNSTRLGQLCADWMRPLRKWLAAAGGALAAELAERYRVWRFKRGIQTYADQIDAALAVLQQPSALDRIRAEGWRVILDEAQDTDPQQFAVLVEITRPAGAEPGTWPAAEGQAPALPPRPGHFCLVGDGQQSIYSSRADLQNFKKHLRAYERGEGGELLSFTVTFRTPRRLIDFFNAGFPKVFSPERNYNLGLAPAEDAPIPYLQVEYQPLEAAPGSGEGAVVRLPLSAPSRAPEGVEAWMEAEAEQIAAFLAAHGPRGVGARCWGEVCVLAPRNRWLLSVQKAFEKAGLKVALQTRQNPLATNPVYCWLSGLLAVVCDPENTFEWFGVLREIFTLSDRSLAQEIAEHRTFAWDCPEAHPPETAAALAVLRPFICRVEDAGAPLGKFIRELAAATRLDERAQALDPAGGLQDELSRLLAEADQRGLVGVSVREWLADLLLGRDDSRPSGKADAAAINLLTSHSAKGLEWPVVIPVGLWRTLSSPPEIGMRLIQDVRGGWSVYLDADSVPPDTREARERERLREAARLLYVTFTRAQECLIIPWGADFGQKGRRDAMSFAEFWADDAGLLALPTIAPDQTALADAATLPAVASTQMASVPSAEQSQPECLPASLPPRLLPHQLADVAADPVRTSRHESFAGEVLLSPAGEEAIEYGLWWHETMEFLPRKAEPAALARYLQTALERSRAGGFHLRASAELEAFTHSAVWLELHDSRWTSLTELSVFSPCGDGALGWLDGVVDLVLHDPVARECRVVDWKTNHLPAGRSPEGHLQTLRDRYAPQLRAYTAAMQRLFPGQTCSAWVFATAVADWIEVPLHASPDGEKAEHPARAQAGLSGVGEAAASENKGGSSAEESARKLKKSGFTAEENVRTLAVFKNSVTLLLNHYGQPQEETPSEDVEAQAPQAPEG